MFGSSSDLNHMPIFSGRNSGTTRYQVKNCTISGTLKQFDSRCQCPEGSQADGSSDVKSLVNPNQKVYLPGSGADWMILAWSFVIGETTRWDHMGISRL